MPIEAKGLKVGHVNCCSLLRHQDEVFYTMKGMDIICISETWLTDNASDMLIHQYDYEVFRQDRSLKQQLPNGKFVTKRGGGLAIYLKKGLAIHTLVLPKVSRCTSQLEQLWVNISKPGNKKMILGLIYRPPNGKVKEFVSELTESYVGLGLEDASPHDVIIMGDFNINYFDKQSMGYTRLREFEQLSGLRQLIKAHTRITNRSKSLIDLIFTNIRYISKSGTLSEPVADHLPIYMVKKRPRDNHTKCVIYKRDFKHYRTEDFTVILSADWEWNSFWLVKNDPNKLWDVMVRILIRAADKLYPIKKISSWNERPNWMSDNLVLLLNRKNKAHKRAVLSGKEKDWEEFKKLKGRSRVSMLRAKKYFIISKLGCKNKDPKKFWREMGTNLKMGKHAPTNSFTKIKDTNGNLLENKEAANFINTYFTNIGEELARRFTVDWKSNGFFEILNTNKFSFNFATEKMVEQILKGLPVNKASGVEYLSSTLLRDGLLCMLTETTYLMNECLESGIMPTKWKIGCISPMPKGKGSTSPGDWRPVSVLPLPSKVIERIVYNQIVYHFEWNNYLFKNQHGFRKGFSTSSAIYDYVQYLYDNYDLMNVTSSLFIDYSKAFDTIDHSILLRKLRLYDLDEKSLQWFGNYLSNRQQLVKANGNVFSNLQQVKTGVPQGSILGPFLFVVYVNDLIYSMRAYNSEITLYADDTVLYSAANNVYASSAELKLSLYELYEWCNVNRLSINWSKTKQMVVSRDCLDDVNIPVLKIDGESISNVSFYNYLGVIVDNKLQFDNFLDSKYNKVNQRVYQLGKLRKIVSSDIAITIYKQMILPLLDYADFIIECGRKVKIDKLERLQERALKFVNNGLYGYENISELYAVFNVQTLALRYREHISCFMYRQSKIDGNIEYRRPSINLRSNGKVKFKAKRKRKYELYLKSPKVRGVKLWEMLPLDVQRATTKVKFKKLIKEICRT